MFAAATSFFARTNISQNYNISAPTTGFGASGSGSRSSTPGPSGSSSPSGSSAAAPAAYSPPVTIGLWKVQSATHKVNGKRVSVWSFDKRLPEMERMSQLGKESTLDVLKAEASALSRLRHPSILEMVEPLEETRTELIFATEPVISSLELAIPGSGRFASLVELDEVEIQKGVLQICKGLSFMHSSAQLIHSNISPESIIINSAGDWKISGLGLTIPLMTDGRPTRWEFPSYDGRMPSYTQRNFDYMAPEYALDEQLVTGSDMYSLGCLLYTVHCKGTPPFKTHGSLGGIRDNAGRSLPGMDRLDSDLQVLLRSLITRHATSRPTPTTIPTHQFFSSLPISTLNFLDRQTFTAKTREEKISFMKGLTHVLDKFSEGLRTRKILPSLLEEMKDMHLLPYILPNVFAISTSLSPTQFANMVLPSLKPLFAVKEPPQNMLTLLENLTMLQSKTEKSVFRQQVLPLVYNSLESDHAVVQERALRAVPDLCESIDYAEVQSVLFPRVALVFTKTTVLSVKVATLNTFLSMVKTLDQSSLTQKLVPLLSKIRTKEPAVMMATLAVQEAMGAKVDREAVATLVLPQLWAMSMGPLLNLNQFQRFMSVIRELGDRVEREHNQYLRDAQRIEDRSATPSLSNGSALGVSANGGLDFESLVGRNSNGLVPATTGSSTDAQKAKSWDDDVWGSIFNDTASNVQSPGLMPLAPQSTSSSASSLTPQTQSLPSSPKMRTNDFQPRPSKLGAKAVSSSSFNNSAFDGMGSSSMSSGTNGFSSPPLLPPPQQQQQNNGFFQPSPMMASSPSPQMQTTQSQKPNYNIAMPSMSPTFNLPQTSPMVNSTPGMGIQQQSMFSSPMAPTPSGMNMGGAMGMGMGGMLSPSKPASSNNAKKASNNDWGDFDPLK